MTDTAPPLAPDARCQVVPEYAGILTAYCWRPLVDGICPIHGELTRLMPEVP